MRKVVAAFCFCITTLSIIAQNNLYVSTIGNNANTGTLAAPFRTIQYGADQLQAGDTLNILAGTYNEKVSINNSGTSNARITLRNYQNQQAIVSGAGITTQDAIIAVDDKTNINIIGLEIANNIQNDAQGIVLSGKPQNITIADCKIHDIHFSANANATVNANTNAQGIIVYGNTSGSVVSNILVTGNELYNCRLGYSEGIAINGNIDGFEISNNYVHNLSNIGIDAIGHEGTCANPTYDQARHGIFSNNLVHDCISPYATSGGIYIDGAKNIVIERNTTFHNGYGIEVGCENIGKSADSITVRNNFVYNNEVAGIALGGYDYPTGSGKVMNSVIESNSIFMNDYTHSGSGELLVSYVENAKVYNNILYATSENIMFSVGMNNTNIHLDNNLYYAEAGMDNMEFYWQGQDYTGLANYQTTLNQDQHSIYALPQFVNASLPSPDLHLQANSTCVNNGLSYSSDLQQLDIDGEPRYNGSIDLGADEYYTGTGINDIAEIEVSIYPNPTVDACIVNAQDLERIELYNTNGQLLLAQKHNALNLKEYIAGVYYLRIYTRQGSAAKRLVKVAFDGQ